MADPPGQEEPFREPARKDGLDLLHWPARERPGDVEELQLQGLVTAFHLAGGGRRVRLGEPLDDAVAAAEPLEQHLGQVGLAESPLRACAASAAGTPW